MKRMILATIVVILVAACGSSGGSPTPSPLPTLDLSGLDPCTVIPASSVEELVGPFRLPPAKLQADASGAVSCNYVGEQANVTTSFLPAAMSADLWALYAQQAIANGGVPVPDVGTAAVAVDAPPTTTGTIVVTYVEPRQFTVTVNIDPQAQTNPLPEAKFVPVAAQIANEIWDAIQAAS